MEQPTRTMILTLMCPILNLPELSQQTNEDNVEGVNSAEAERGFWGADVSVVKMSPLPDGYANGPKEGELTPFPFRAISAAMMPREYVDFAHNDGKALRDSVPLMDGITSFKDHNRNVGDWIGKVTRSWWSDPEKIQGKRAPAGVDAEISIDKVKEPDIVRGLNAGILKSVSVTVSFDWKKSHPKMTDDEFFKQLGKKIALSQAMKPSEQPEDDIVRILPTKITKYYEVSVVWEGLDKYAKQLPTKASDDYPSQQVLAASCQLEDGSCWKLQRSEDSAVWKSQREEGEAERAHNNWSDSQPDWGSVPKDASVPDACFAYAPAKIAKSERKLPHHFMSGNTMYVHPVGVSLALAALSSNPPHGNKVKLPAGWDTKCTSHLNAAKAFCDSHKAKKQVEGKTQSRTSVVGGDMDHLHRHDQKVQLAKTKEIKHDVKKGGLRMDALLEQICSVLTFGEGDGDVPVALVEVCGAFERQVTEEKEDLMNQVNALNEQVTELEGQLSTTTAAFDEIGENLSTLMSEHQTLQAEVDGLKQRAIIGDQYIADVRKEALDSFQKVSALKLVTLSKDAVEALKKQINEGDVAFVKACRQMYAAQLEEALPLVCTKCGTKMIRRSSKEVVIDPKDGSQKQIPKINMD